MVSKPPPIPIQLQTFRRRPRRWHRLRWLVAGGLVAAPLIWFMVRPPGVPAPQSAAPVSTANTKQAAGPPWRLGIPEARFTIVFYADLECPYCKSYSPQLRQWVDANTHSDGRGVPNLDAFPDMSEELKACMNGEESARIVQAQAADATASGITATPSLRLIDRTSGRSLMLPGPVAGDSLLSAIDMLATNDLADAKPSASPDSPASADGGMPR